MGNYNLPPDIADQFSALTARVAALERGKQATNAGVRRSTAQVIPATGSGTFSFDTVEFDNGHLWDAASPTRLTVPPNTRPSVFSLWGSMDIPTAATGNLYVTGSLRVNGVTLAAYNTILISTLYSVSLPISRPAFVLKAGDYLELVLINGSSNNLSVNSAKMSLTIQE
jgi:hypothetical protein